MEMPGHDWRSRVRLASADADRVIPLSDDRISILVTMPRSRGFKIEMNFLARASFEMNALKSAESNERCTLTRRGT